MALSHRNGSLIGATPCLNQARHSGARASANPESPLQLPDSGFDAPRRPGM